MKREYHFFVYIVASDSRTLYVGFTNNLRRRVFEHKESKIEGFTKKYHCNRLVYFEYHDFVESAIDREKKIKKWRREKKIELIEKENGDWRDLSDDWEKEG